MAELENTPQEVPETDEQDQAEGTLTKRDIDGYDWQSLYPNSTTDGYDWQSQPGYVIN